VVSAKPADPSGSRPAVMAARLSPGDGGRWWPRLSGSGPAVTDGVPVVGLFRGWGGPAVPVDLLGSGPPVIAVVPVLGASRRRGGSVVPG
jgi:hypothetical protein